MINKIIAQTSNVIKTKKKVNFNDCILENHPQHFAWVKKKKEGSGKKLENCFSSIGATHCMLNQRFQILGATIEWCMIHFLLICMALAHESCYTSHFWMVIDHLNKQQNKIQAQDQKPRKTLNTNKTSELVNDINITLFFPEPPQARGSQHSTHRTVS